MASGLDGVDKGQEQEGDREWGTHIEQTTRVSWKVNVSPQSRL